MASTTAGTLVTTGLKRWVKGPCWNLNLRFPACARTWRRMSMYSSYCSVSSEKGMSVLHLRRTCFVSPIGCLFLFSCSQNCLHFCTQLSQCTHNSQLCMRWLKLKVVSSAQIKSHRHVIHVCTCAFLLLSLYFLDPFIKNNLSGHVADTNTALLRQKRVWPFGQNSSPTGYEPNVIDNFDYSKTAEIFFQEQSGDTMPSYLHDAELSDETIGKALSSPRFTQEREEPAGRRQAYHSFEESLLPSRSLSVCHVSTERPVNEHSSLSSCSSRQMENETKEELPRNLQEKNWLKTSSK